MSKTFKWISVILMMFQVVGEVLFHMVIFISNYVPCLFYPEYLLIFAPYSGSRIFAGACLAIYFLSFALVDVGIILILLNKRKIAYALIAQNVFNIIFCVVVRIINRITRLDTLIDILLSILLSLLLCGSLVLYLLKSRNPQRIQ